MFDQSHEKQAAVARLVRVLRCYRFKLELDARIKDRESFWGFNLGVGNLTTEQLALLVVTKIDAMKMQDVRNGSIRGGKKGAETKRKESRADEIVRRAGVMLKACARRRGLAKRLSLSFPLSESQIRRYLKKAGI